MAKYGGLHGGAGSKEKIEIKDSSSTFQTNLLSIRQSFEDAIESLRLESDHIIFIDGIDVRPAEIEYDE